MRNFKELANNLNYGDYGDRIVDSVGLYDDRSFDSIISEVADGIVSADVTMDVLGETALSDADAVIDEFGWEGVGRSVENAMRMSIAIKYERDMMEHLPDIAKGMAVGYLEAEEGINIENGEISDDLYATIEKWCDEVDSSDYPSDLMDIINDYFEGEG